MATKKHSGAAPAAPAEDITESASTTMDRAAALARISELLTEIGDLTEAARQIGEPLDQGGRLLGIAIERLMPEVLAKFSDLEIHGALDILYDVEGILCGAEAFNRGKPRGILMVRALECIEEASKLMDRVWLQTKKVQS